MHVFFFMLHKGDREIVTWEQIQRCRETEIVIER